MLFYDYNYGTSVIYNDRTHVFHKRVKLTNDNAVENIIILNIIMILLLFIYFVKIKSYKYLF